ncbi:hypothetical protein SJ05684_c15670 [Sinorhizobium sojae CCBAU 05684]|uniref:Uncharacterized protein n=1 Tax=Sinorhizobium sojae CCBAU 05684 TaxID=716928 RepID=A0A249PCM2_9HYPH|nr:hypothetical protein SJ05684_c15670 [Sinorhizobium sojae CCBAU 05684]
MAIAQYPQSLLASLLEARSSPYRYRNRKETAEILGKAHGERATDAENTPSGEGLASEAACVPCT